MLNDNLFYLKWEAEFIYSRGQLFQERLALKESGSEVGPAMLFFGCRKRKMVNSYQQ
jgi:hypothetical protein